jgi:hypothetical protein
MLLSTFGNTNTKKESLFCWPLITYLRRYSLSDNFQRIIGSRSLLRLVSLVLEVLRI